MLWCVITYMFLLASQCRIWWVQHKLRTKIFKQNFCWFFSLPSLFDSYSRCTMSQTRLLLTSFVCLCSLVSFVPVNWQMTILCIVIPLASCPLHMNKISLYLTQNNSEMWDSLQPHNAYFKQPLFGRGIRLSRQLLWAPFHKPVLQLQDHFVQRSAVVS